jgi:hypothetical protein
MLEIYTLLNPKVANYNGTGGSPAITPEDVAACLGRIQIRGPGLLVRAMAGDPSCLSPLRVIFGQNLAQMANLKRWKTGPTFWPYMDGLRDSVLHFYVIPDSCHRCHGHGSITLCTQQVIACPLCEGVGRKEPKETDKARSAQINIETWRATWAGRYTDARAILSDWEDIADRATKRLWWQDC